MKKFVVLIQLSLVFASIVCSADSSASLVKKKINVTIISGTYTGEKGEAIVSYDNSKAKKSGDETIDGNEITFKFLEQTVTGKPQIALSQGKFKDVLWVASIKNREGQSFNFGFNTGFQRLQFNRPSEAFIRDNKSYFGYLFPNTYVDGAGTIHYSDVENNDVEASDPCQNANGVSEKTRCIALAFAESEKDLNEIYKKLQNQLSSAQKITLRDAERKWLKFRDETCIINSSLDLLCCYKVNHSRTEFLRDRSRECTVGHCRNDLLDQVYAGETGECGL